MYSWSCKLVNLYPVTLNVEPVLDSAKSFLTRDWLGVKLSPWQIFMGLLPCLEIVPGKELTQSLLSEGMNLAHRGHENKWSSSNDTGWEVLWLGYVRAANTLNKGMWEGKWRLWRQNNEQVSPEGWVGKGHSCASQVNLLQALLPKTAILLRLLPSQPLPMETGILHVFTYLKRARLMW